MRLEGNWDHVADVLNALKDYPKAIEFRHESWDDPWVLSALREHETAWVNIDEPRLGASLHGTDHVTAPIAYLRLHGRNYQKWFNSQPGRAIRLSLYVGRIGTDRQVAGRHGEESGTGAKPAAEKENLGGKE